MLHGSLTQGGFITGRVAPGTRVALDEFAVPVSPEGVFALGFSRDAGPAANLGTIDPDDGSRTTRSLMISPREWHVQRIDGLPERQVTPDRADLARIRAEQERLNAARKAESPVGHYAHGLLWPARGRISGVYGSQRILNGQPRAPHLGLDVAGPVGTPIVAAATGHVTLVGDFYFTGLTLLIEHGQGVTTLYAHSSRVLVSEGQEVQRGQHIADMGATGRATGSHLHLGLFWRGIALDPKPALTDT